MAHFPAKLLIPQRPPDLVSRPRLTKLLRRINQRRVITLVAPAGYGKTALLIDFANDSPSLPICWYSLDHFDEDPWVFLDSLTMAVAQRFPGATKQTARLLASAGRIALETVVATLVRDICAIGSDLVIIFDDWHLIDQVAAISAAITRLQRECANCHLILSSRNAPRLPNLRPAEQRQISSIDEQHLRFTAAEIVAVFKTAGHAAISFEQAQALIKQANGWVMGIMLVHGSTEAPPPAMRAEHEIYRFLVEQVFERQPPEIRAFLLDTALLEQLTPESCDHIRVRSDSASLLDWLIRYHLFVSTIRPGVLRYHPLFHEFLQAHARTTDPERYQAGAHRLATSYADQHQWTKAFDIYIATDDLSGARDVVAAGGEQLYAAGHLETLERWFAVLPEDDLDALLLCLKARVLIDRGRIVEAQELAHLAEMRQRPSDVPQIVLLQANLARVSGRYEDAIALLQRIFRITRNLAHQAAALRLLAICHHQLGQTNHTVEELKRALVIERQRGDHYAMALLEYDLSVCYRDAGLLHSSEQHAQTADAYWEAADNRPLRALSLNSIGVVQHLLGQYHEAQTTFKKALRYAQDSVVPVYQAVVFASLGDFYSDMQHWTPARTAYDSAHRLSGSVYLRSSVELALVRLLVRQRQYEDAAVALRALPANFADHLSNAMLLLRGSIAYGLKDYQQARNVVEQAIAALERTNASLELARAYLLHARIIATAAPAERTALIAALDRAAQIADHLGHDVFLVVEASHMPDVLRSAVAAGWLRASDWLQRQWDIRSARRWRRGPYPSPHKPDQDA